jgi:hypothetical protein
LPRWTSILHAGGRPVPLPAVAGAPVIWHRGSAFAAKRAEHALGAAGLRVLVAAAAFKNIEIRTAAKMARFSSAASYVRIQLAATQLATLITSYDTARRNHPIDALAEDVARTWRHMPEATTD